MWYFFHSVLWHCWLGGRKGMWLVKKLYVGLLVAMIWLELCTTYSSSCPVVTTTSKILSFNKHWLTWVSEWGRERERETERQRDRETERDRDRETRQTDRQTDRHWKLWSHLTSCIYHTDTSSIISCCCEIQNDSTFCYRFTSLSWNWPINACKQFPSSPRGQCWRRSIVVRTLVSAGELSLSCTRLAGWVTTLWLSRPLSVSRHGQLSHPSLRGR